MEAFIVGVRDSYCDGRTATPCGLMAIPRKIQYMELNKMLYL